MERNDAHRTSLCVALLVALGFSLGCSEFAVIGVEPDIAAAYGVTLARAGELVSVYALAFAVATPVLAVATGRFRRFHLLVAYSLLFCAANAAAMLAPTFELLWVSRAVLGAVSGPLIALGVTYVPELVGVKRSSMAISVIYAAFSIAMVVATSAGKLVAELLDWHLVLVGALAFALAVCAALVTVLPRTGEQDEPAGVAEQVGLLAEPPVLTSILVFLFGVGSVYTFYGYVTPYLEDVLGLSPVATSTVLMAYGAVCFFSNLLSGWTDGRFGMKALLVTFPVQAALLVGLYLAGGDAAPALAAVMLVALSMYIVSVPCITLFMRTARRRHPKALTLASSLEPMAFNMGISFGTAMGGMVVSGPGIRYAGLVGAAFSLTACALVAVTLVLSRRREARARAEARASACTQRP